MVLFGLTVIVFNSTSSNTAVSAPDPDVPRPGGPLLGGRRRLRRPDRPAADPDRDERPARAGLRGALPRRREPRGHPAAQHLRLDGHGLLRAGRAGDDPGPGAARPAARRERHLHADPQRGLRARASPCSGRSSSSWPGPEAVILVVAGLYFLAAIFCVTLPGVAAAAIDRGDATFRARGRGGRAQRSARRSASCAKGSASSAANRSIAWSLHLPRHHRLARSGVLGVLGPALRQADARSRGQGLRGRRPARSGSGS